MRILVQGKRPEDTLYMSTCRNCKTVFEYSAKDLGYDSNHIERFYSCKCPFCNNLLYFDSDISTWIPSTGANS